jgi:hypothetical protein
MNNNTNNNASFFANILPRPSTMATKASYEPRIVASPNEAVASQSLHPTSSNLAAKLVGDAVVGTGVTLLMAPLLTIADKGIAQRAARTHTLLQSCAQSARSIISNPVAFARNPAFLYVWGVYATTYTTANSLKTLVDHQEQSTRKTTVTSSKDGSSLGQVGIFLGTSVANSGASLLKDRAFAKMFSPDAATNTVTKSVPKQSYALWMTRDLIGVGSSFVLPDLIAKKLSASTPEELKRNRDISQFCVPVATQLVAGPLHLLGLDFYNRPMQDMSWKQAAIERYKCLVNGSAAVITGRVARIIPGYGFGGVLNTKFRESWREYLSQPESQDLLQLPSFRENAEVVLNTLEETPATIKIATQ